MGRQWYVWNDKVKHKVDDCGRGTMYAVAMALSKCGYADQTEVPADAISWPFFYLDERGFRSQPELFQSTIGPFGETVTDLIQEGAPKWIMREAALNWFDHYMKEFDPFCENENDD